MKSSYILLFLLNIILLIVWIFLLTTIPNPLPIIIMITAYITQLFFFRTRTATFAIVCFFFISMYLAVDTMDTHAVSMKCAHETNLPVEERDTTLIQNETEEFDACLAGITFFDKVYFGLFK